MKLFCKKCSTQVTNELTLTNDKNSENDYTYESVDAEYDFRKYTYKLGIYRLKLVKNYLFDTLKRPSYTMNPSEILVDIKGSHGCCSYDHGEIICKCGESLGTAKDDCWQDTIAYVLKSKTIRCNV